jgi:hypothetical protein
MTTTTSRRAVLAGAAASIPATALAALPIDPDAELLAIGTKHEALVAQFLDATHRAEPNEGAFRNAYAAWRLDHPYAGNMPEEEWQTLSDRIDREYPVAAPMPDDCTDAMGPLLDRMFEFEAQTARGLLVKIRALAFYGDREWSDALEAESDRDLDLGPRIFRQVYDDLRRIAAGKVVQS